MRIGKQWAIALLFGLMVWAPNLSSQVSCTPSTTGPGNTLCGQGLLGGHSFVADATMRVDSIVLPLCLAGGGYLELRKPAETGESWETGALLATSVETVPGGMFSDCLLSQNGLDNYVLRTFTFDNAGVEEGEPYCIVVRGGFGAVSCGSVNSGNAWYAGSMLSASMAHVIHGCEGPWSFGCIEEEACNFAPEANLSNGTCQEADCQGVCGGEAILDPDCGCVEGPDAVGQCIGCTDPSACNLAPVATIDDGSCTYPDCSGTCGGGAVETPCGCAGGGTGILPSDCVAGCGDFLQTEGTSMVPCPPAYLTSQVWLPSESGDLSVLRVRACCATPTQLQVRRSNPAACDGWGTPVWVSEEVSGECVGSCGSSAGLANHEEVEFTPGIPVLAGEPLLLEFAQGLGTTACDAEAALFGPALDINGAAVAGQLAMQWSICTRDIQSGCLDETACNFDQLAEVEDGSCLTLDCHGDCGGTGVATACGCLGGSSTAEADQCISGNIEPVWASTGDPCGEPVVEQVVQPPYDAVLHAASFWLDVHAGHSWSLDSIAPDGERVTLGQWEIGGAGAGCSPAPQWEWFTFDLGAIALDAEATYSLRFLLGMGMADCMATFPWGEALDANGDLTSGDMLVRLVHSVAEGAGVYGCTDPEACNVDEVALFDDGSCHYCCDEFGAPTDDQPPVFVNEPDTLDIGCDEPWPDYALPAAIDDCGAVTVTFIGTVEMPLFEASCSSTLREYAYLAEDEVGNTAVLSRVVRRIDAAEPVWSAFPPDRVESCLEFSAEVGGDVPLADVPVAIDPACHDQPGSAVTVFMPHEEWVIPGACDAEFQFVRTWGAQDACGNITYRNHVVQVTDQSGPSFLSIPSDTTVWEGQVPPSELAEVIVMDGCSEPVLTVTDLSIAGGSPSEMVVKRTFHLVDDCGLEAQALQWITVLLSPGCMTVDACNFDADALNALPGACQFPADEFGVDYVDCEGQCLSDVDGDGVCDEAEVEGCTYPDAENYDSAATQDDGSCTFSAVSGPCDISGCTDPEANNYMPSATEDDGSCAFGSCQYDADGNNLIGSSDLLVFLAAFGTNCLTGLDASEGQ